ncbi:MAG TPA: hypothetical protein PK986_00315 [Spirochaetota bacterium]|nr:hypothetical protein [Spirochaetota bacterium]HQO38889.1 hypothetical protein [Spirochaetota bacterium]
MKNLFKITMPVILVMILASLLPGIFPCVDTAQFKGNYRIPYSQGENYFLYEKYINRVASSGRIAVIGDSVIWGHYTGSDDNLVATLNASAGTDRFANIGIDGIHPAALYGLIDNYCASLSNRRVIIGINLLWMSSPRHDLSGGVNTSINHSALLSQVPGRIPAYSPSVEERLTLLARRKITLFAWIDHIRASRFADRSVYRWTMANPRACPGEYLAGQEESYTPPDPVQPDRMTGRDMDWVMPADSLQWMYMIKSIRKLKTRGNDVIAVITPFNRFMLTEKSRLERDMIISVIRETLSADGIPVIVPELDKAEYYADLSHPVAEGYSIMAMQLAENTLFAEFTGQHK